MHKLPLSNVLTKVFFIYVSRSLDKLSNTAREIESKHGVCAKTVQVDFAESDEDYVPRIRSAIAGLDIAVLVSISFLRK